jgi:hypothetical protein
MANDCQEYSMIDDSQWNRFANSNFQQHVISYSNLMYALVVNGKCNTLIFVKNKNLRNYLFK